MVKRRKLRFANTVRIAIFLIIPLLSISFAVFAHEEASSVPVKNLQTTALTTILISSGIIIGLVVLAAIAKPKVEGHKWLIFGGIVVATIIATAYSGYSTIFLNLNSVSGGPVHWHADFELWNCDNAIELIEPSGLTNRIGESDFHEHGDMRIHVEGVVVEYDDVSIDRFIESIGGEVSEDKISLPTEHGLLDLQNGDACNGLPGKWQGFLYKITNPDPRKKSGFVYTQEKLTDFGNYILSPYSNVPPGDCIVIEFGNEKDFTEHICESYETAVQRGDLTGS